MKKQKESKQKKISKKDEKIQERMGSSNIKKKSFEEMELGIYEMRESDIEIILEYQEKLPILQQDNDNWIDARVLWEQLKVGRDFSTRVKQQIEDIGLEKSLDYKLSPTLGKTSQLGLFSIVCANFIDFIATSFFNASSFLINGKNIKFNISKSVKFCPSFILVSNSANIAFPSYLFIIILLG